MTKRKKKWQSPAIKRILSKEERDRLVMDNQNIVVYAAREMSRYGVNFFDLVQEGNLGLMIAVDKYNPDRPEKFTTMARWWVRKYIMEFVMKKHLIHIPFRVQWSDAKKNKENTIQHARCGGQLKSRSYSIFSYDYDYQIPNGEDIEDWVDRRLKIVKINRAMENLSDTEKKIFGLYILDEGPESIHKEFGISKQRVSQIYYNALSKISSFFDPQVH